MAQGKSTYRPDIDGLRAVAVLLVVARHLRITRLSGGFIGVDVFFVISGFLIGGILLRERADETFSLWAFYERRIRRIVPAFLVMLAACTALAWHFLYPNEMVAYAHSLLAAVFGVSNFLFWSWAGYFDGPNELKPLLHTWSLGVEEQFYLLFSLTLWFFRRIQIATLKRAILTIAAISFVAACWATWQFPPDGFFLTQFRVWELLVGVILAQSSVPALRTAMSRNIASAAGLAMILATALLYSAHTPFPGLAAIPPCLGAAFIIAGGQTGTSFVGRGLSLRPVVFVGTISYSLYLWHWPVQVFWDYAHLLDGRKENDWRGIAIVFAISMVLAVASWALVETPVRRPGSRLYPARRRLFVGAATLAGIAVLGATLLWSSGGGPTRFSPQAVRAAAYLDYDNHTEDRWGTCAVGPFGTDVAALEHSQECLPYRAGARHFLLLGDSHAAHLWPGLSTVLPDLDIAQVNLSECPILVGLEKAPKMCAEISRFLFDQYIPTHPMEALLVSYRWLDQNLNEVDALVAYARQHNTRIILFGPTIEYTMPLPRLLAMSITDGRGTSEVEAHEQRRPRELDIRMAQMARERWGIEYISFFAELCSNEECPTQFEGGAPMIFDANHLTAAAATRWMQIVKARGEIK